MTSLKVLSTQESDFFDHDQDGYFLLIKVEYLDEERIKTHLEWASMGS